MNAKGVRGVLEGLPGHTMTGKGGDRLMENQTHKGNYKGTTHMNAKNQDMAFVNDNVEDAKSVSNFSTVNKKTDPKR